MAERDDRLRAAVAELISKDSKLGNELKGIHARESKKLRMLERVPAMAGPEGALSLPGDEMPPMAVETIVMRTGRPVLAIKHNDAELGQLDFSDAESQEWRKKLVAAHDHLVAATRAVGRIELQNNPDYEWVGTGWLVAKDVVVTNRHVASIFAQRRGENFVFRAGTQSRRMNANIDFLEEVDNPDSAEFKLDEVLHIEDEPGPDMAFLRVSPAGKALAAPIRLANAMFDPGREVAVIGYPARDSRIPDQDLMEQIFGTDKYNKKRLAPGEIKPSEDGLVLHDCSTLGGNSGSVVLDLKTGQAAALHFSGRFLLANYAVPAAQIAAGLERLQGGGRSRRKAAPDANEDGGGNGGNGDHGDHGDVAGLGAPRTSYIRNALAGKTRVTCTVPLRLTIELGDAVVGGAAVAPAPRAERDGSSRDENVILEGTPQDYSNRKGFDEGFLGKAARVTLPAVTKSPGDVLTFTDAGKKASVLKYEHFSVVMNRPRRLCYFSAVNIDGAKTRKQVRGAWRLDPRIPVEQQIKGECYGNPPKFSRGHMTRREDPIWGTKAVAERGGNDSMHVTNVVPQMQAFNAPIWLGLEDYALQHAREDDMKISVITGPFLLSNDPIRYGVKIPRSCWKVIAFIHDKTKKLTATGYTISQDSLIPEEEFVFGQFTTGDDETTQVALATIEEKAGISFGKLTDHDPLGREESFGEMHLRGDFKNIRFF